MNSLLTFEIMLKREASNSCFLMGKINMIFLIIHSGNQMLNSMWRVQDQARKRANLQKKAAAHFPLSIRKRIWERQIPGCTLHTMVRMAKKFLRTKVLKLASITYLSFAVCIITTSKQRLSMQALLGQMLGRDLSLAISSLMLSTNCSSLNHEGSILKEGIYLKLRIKAAMSMF